MLIIMSDKIFYHAGEVVRIKQDIHKPEMVVKGIKKTLIRTEKRKVGQTQNKEPNRDSGVLLGVECYWFTSAGEYQSGLFNTKDLEYVPGKNPGKD